jgi:hypothetical protein
MLKILNPLLKVKHENRTDGQIIGWWEIRRLLYNLIVLVFGCLSITIMLLINKNSLEEPFGIFVFAFACNVCYTLGWIAESIFHKRKNLGPRLFKAGLLLTLVVSVLPAVLYVIVDLVNKLR